LDNKFCPYCNKMLVIKSDKAYSYDPILLVEEILYYCPECGYEQKVENLKLLA